MKFWCKCNNKWIDFDFWMFELVDPRWIHYWVPIPGEDVWMESVHWRLKYWRVAGPWLHSLRCVRKLGRVKQVAQLPQRGRTIASEIILGYLSHKPLLGLCWSISADVHYGFKSPKGPPVYCIKLKGSRNKGGRQTVAEREHVIVTAANYYRICQDPFLVLITI